MIAKALGGMYPEDTVGYLSILSREEIEALGPPIPEELIETGVSNSCLRDLALKCLASVDEPISAIVAENLKLPAALTEELLYQLYREKLVEMRLQSSAGGTRYAMLDRGWQRLEKLYAQCGYVGPAPVSLDDYTHMMRIQAVPSLPSSLEMVRKAFSDLVLPESLLQTLGCAIQSRTSLLLTGVPGTGKTAVSERINAATSGSIWIPYAIEVDGDIVRLYDSHCHRPAADRSVLIEHDRRWVEIERPLIMVGGELTFASTNLTWSESARFYESPLHIKANGGTLVIDDFGRQRVAPRELLNRWIFPLERRSDFLSLNNGKKIEFPFEQLLVFSTIPENEYLFDEAFLRPMGYRAHIEPPTRSAYVEIFRRAARDRGLSLDQANVKYLLQKYVDEKRPMKACEPRDLLNRMTDICRFENRPVRLNPELLDAAWKNYFGTSHSFDEGKSYRKAGQARSAAV